MKAYLLRLICAAFVCALTDAVSHGPGQKTRQMVAGLFLTLTALSVPKGQELPKLDFGRYLQEADTVAATGQIQAQEAQKDIITDAFTAYILTEANALGLEPVVQVTLKDDLTPSSVTLTGKAAPAVRRALSETVAEALGLGEEDVIWKDLHQSSA